MLYTNTHTHNVNLNAFKSLIGSADIYIVIILFLSCFAFTHTFVYAQELHNDMGPILQSFLWQNSHSPVCKIHTKLIAVLCSTGVQVQWVFPLWTTALVNDIKSFKISVKTQFCLVLAVWFNIDAWLFFLKDFQTRIFIFCIVQQLKKSLFSISLIYGTSFALGVSVN